MPPSDAHLATALGRRSIRRVTLGFFSITLAEWILGVAAAISLFDDHGAIAVALVGARFVPAAIASMLTADLVDRHPPRTILAASSAGRMLTALAAVALAATPGALIAVPLLLWLDASIGATYRPAQARLLPSVARTPAELVTVATLCSTAKSSGQILGAFAGALIAAAGGLELGAGIAAVLFAVGMLCAGRPRRLEGSARRVTPPSAGVRAAFDALRASPGAAQIAGWACARSFARGAWSSLGVLAALVLLGMQETGYSILMGAAGVGTVVGIVLSGRLAARRSLAAPFATALGLPGAAFVAIGVVATPIAAVVAMVAWGAGMALSDVSAQALLTRVVAPSASARVTGLIEGSKLLSEGLGGLAAPLVAELIGLRAAFYGGGLLLLAALLLDLEGFRRVDRAAVGRVDLLELARRVPWFRSVRLDGLEALVAPLQSLHVPAGEIVIQQDLPGSRWYLVRSGRFDVEVDGFKVGEVTDGGSFGERGLMRDEPRTATVRAAVPSEVLVLEREDFLRALTGTDSTWTPSGARDTEPLEILRRLPLLHAADEGTIDQMCGAARRRSVPAGAVLFEQGDTADEWLVILDGSVEITVDGEPRRVLGGGDALGEIAVLHQVPRTARASAVTPTLLLAVPGPVLRAALAAA